MWRLKQKWKLVFLIATSSLLAMFLMDNNLSILHTNIVDDDNYKKLGYKITNNPMPTRITIYGKYHRDIFSLLLIKRSSIE